MKPVQKVIKYLAMAFAVFLMVTILSGIVSAVAGVSWSNDAFGDNIEYSNITNEYDGVKDLEISNHSGNMNITYGDVSKVVVEGKNVPSTMTMEVTSDGTLVIDESSKNFWIISIFNWGFNNKRTEINITLPRDFIAGNAYLENGSGRFDVQGLKANSIKFDGGSGRFTGTDMKANKADIAAGSGGLELTNCIFGSTSVDGGSGQIQLIDNKFNDSEFYVGSGSFYFSGEFDGPVKVDGGSGSITMEISGNESDYYLDFNDGSGGIWLDGKRVDHYNSDNKGADKEIEIKGGSGRVSVSFN